ncbi:MAG: DUF4430 domain-containing protein [Patescibacteria group bacterium]|nr:DUF4430 domain-containing protein [Patescibacteria group bacterium]
MQRKNITLSALFIISLLLLGGCGSQTNLNQKPAEQDAAQNLRTSPSDISKKEATISINFGNDQVKNFTLEFLPEETVYNLLEKLANQNEINLETKQYDLGTLIEAIDGIKNGQDNKYWLYYVNGQMAPVGVTEQKVSPDDKIEFRFEESSF